MQTYVRTGGGQFKKLNPLYRVLSKNIKELNLFLLIFLGLAIVSISGYFSYATFSTEIYGQKNIELKVGAIYKTITVNQTTGGTITIKNERSKEESTNSLLAKKGDEITVKVTLDRGYELNNITVGESDITETKKFTMPADNIEVNASFRKIGYAITVNQVEGATITATNKTTNQNSTSTLEATIGNIIRVDAEVEEGYELESIKYGDKTIENGQTFTVEDSSIAITAVVKKIDYTIGITKVEGATITVTNVTQNESSTNQVLANINDNIKVSVTVDAGYELESIKFDNKTITNNANITMAVGNKVVTATIKAKEYVVTYEYNGATEGNTNLNKTIIYKTNYGTLPSPTKEGYNFLGWYKEDNFVTKIETTTKMETTSDHKIYAKWEVNGYTVNYDCTTNGGSGSIPSTIVNYNASIDLSKTCTKTGWTFVGWNTNKDATTKLNSLKIGTTNVSLYAIYKKVNNATFTLQDNSAATLDKESASCTMYNKAENCTITTGKLTAKEGYTVIGWNTNQDATTAIVASGAEITINNSRTYYSITKRNDITYKATFTKGEGVSAIEKENLSCSIEGGYNGASSTSTSCNIILPTITASSGYTIKGWYEGNTKVGDAETSLTISSNKTLEAKAHDITAPTIDYVASGGMIYRDPNFASGINGTIIYNNLYNENVTLSRVSMATEYGSYVLKITTSGIAHPSLGGFYFGTESRPEEYMITKIIAKIPLGYTINFGSDSIGDNPKLAWLTSQEGTGDWEEYVFYLKTGPANSSNQFAKTNHYYLEGPEATVTNPVTWYVAYATVYSNLESYQTNGFSFKANDSGSGIVAYGINQSETAEPTWNSVENTKTLGKIVENVATNGTYYIWAKDASGNISKTSVTIDKVDRTAPTIDSVVSGGRLYHDPNFSSGINSTTIYNNEYNGNVAISRTAVSTDYGNYALKITTSGTASPGHGGFYFATQAYPEEYMITKIIAKIPVGYNINFGTNAIGDNYTSTWLSPQKGTGDWEEYVYLVGNAPVNSSREFNTTNFFYLTGGSTPTTSSPLTWYVAYATVFASRTWSPSGGVSLKATDNESGIAAYGINQSETTEPTWNAVSSAKTLGHIFDNITSNGTYYVWVKDKAGNISKKSIVLDDIDNTPPPVTLSVSGGTVTVTSDTPNLYRNYTPETETKNSSGASVTNEVQVSSVSSASYPNPNSLSWQLVYTSSGNKQWAGFQDAFDGQFDGNAGDYIVLSGYSYATKNITLTMGSLATPSWDYYSTTDIYQYSYAISHWNYFYKVYRINEAFSNAILGAAPYYGYVTNQDVTLYLNGLNWRVLPASKYSASDVKIRKYASGSQNASYFKNGGGTMFNDNKFTVSSNGIYSVYYEDWAGNGTVKQISVGSAGTTYTATFNRNNASSIGATQLSCIASSGGSCTVTAPSISAPSATPTVVGWGTSASATSASVNVGGTITLTGNKTYYAITRKNAVTRTASYSKGTGVTSIGTTSNSCTIGATYNGTAQGSSCSVTLPSIGVASGFVVSGWYSGSAKKGNAGASLSLSSNISLVATASANFTLTCPSSSYTNREVSCSTNYAGITITCSGVSLSSSYAASETTTSSKKIKTCLPTSTGTLKVTATSGGVSITRNVTISSPPFTMSCPSSGYAWATTTCSVTAAGVLMECGGDVTMTSADYNLSFTTTSSDMSKTCYPRSTGVLIVKASKSGYSVSKSIPITPNPGGGSGSGSGSGSRTVKYCTVHYAFGDTSTAYYSSQCYTTSRTSCPTVYSSASSCANAGYAAGDYCAVSCS